MIYKRCLGVSGGLIQFSNICLSHGIWKTNLISPDLSVFMGSFLVANSLSLGLINSESYFYGSPFVGITAEMLPYRACTHHLCSSRKPYNRPRKAIKRGAQEFVPVKMGSTRLANRYMNPASHMWSLWSSWRTIFASINLYFVYRRLACSLKVL